MGQIHEDIPLQIPPGSSSKQKGGSLGKPGHPTWGFDRWKKNFELNSGIPMSLCSVISRIQMKVKFFVISKFKNKSIVKIKI